MSGGGDLDYSWQLKPSFSSQQSLKTNLHCFKILDTNSPPPPQLIAVVM